MRNLKVYLLISWMIAIASCSNNDYPRMDDSYIISKLEANYFDKELVSNPEMLIMGSLKIINSQTNLEDYFEKMGMPVFENISNIDFETSSLLLFLCFSKDKNIECIHDFRVQFLTSTAEPFYYYNYSDKNAPNLGESGEEHFWYMTGIIIKKIDDDTPIGLTIYI